MIAESIASLRLQYVVLTSVDRDDLPDGGAGHFAETIRELQAACPGMGVEVLIPDFNGEDAPLRTVMEARPDILNHNIETVPRLYKKVRPGAGYIRSLSIHRWAKEIDPSVVTKSGIMVGLGETKDEVLRVMDDMRDSDIDIMTIGQYLRPSPNQLPVRAFITPE